MVLAGVYFLYSAIVEERYLTQQFPDNYPAYRRSTKCSCPSSSAASVGCRRSPRSEGNHHYPDVPFRGQSRSRQATRTTHSIALQAGQDS